MSKIRVLQYTEDELLMMAAISTKQPSEGYIKLQRNLDRGRNPHNDSYKPAIREDLEIIADYKIEAAKTLRDRLAASIAKER